MKAVVVDIRGKLAATLSDDGHITKVKNQNYAIGQVIEMKEASHKLFRFKTAAAAAVVAVVVLGGAGAYAYCAPYSYVSLDVNPSIEYSLNRFDRVLSVTGVNDDGEEIVKQLKLDTLSNKKIDEAIAETVQQIKDEGFFDGDTPAGIVISTSGKDLKKAEKLAEALKEDAENAAGDETVLVESSAVGLERVQQAQELGVTPGKLNLVEKLRDSAENPDDVDINEWLDKPVKDIMKAIQENRQEDKAAQQNQEDTDESETEVEANAQVEEKAEVQAEEKTQAQTEEKAQAKTEKAAAKAEEKAEAETEKTEAKAEVKAETKSEEKVETKAEEKAETKAEEKAETKAEEKTEAETEKAETKAEEKADTGAEKAETKAEEKAESETEKSEAKAEKAETKEEKSSNQGKGK